ncbi:MAG TPA: S8 family serine peptidase [Polyangiaceae bacterium]|nr:S8 family serine peptidase [Polyangiaceae bacterium]
MLARKGFVLGSALALVAALGAGCGAEAGPPAERVGEGEAPLLGADADAVAGRYLVVLKGGPGGAAAGAARVALRDAESRVEQVFDVLPGFAARLSPDDLAALRRDPAVAYVEHDRVVRLEPARGAGATGDEGDGAIFPLPGGQPDGIDRVDQPSLPRDGQYNDHGCDGGGVLAYVIDTGVRSTHAELAGRVSVARGFTAVADGLGTEDCLGQGTFLASVVAGGRLGLARAATVVPVRVTNCSGAGTTSGIIAGVNHVAANCGDADKCVATLALGGGASSALNAAVGNLVASGVPVAVPLGSTGCTGSPASAPGATVVAGVNDADCPTGTAGGACVDLFGPATTILGASAASDTSTQTLSSTGAAAAHVAGALAQGLSCGYTGTRTTPATCASPAGVKPLVFNDYGAESCAGRCGPFDGLKPCQCDASCASFGDCCADFAAACP